MPKPTITKLFVGSVIAFIGGLIAVIIAAVLLATNGSVELNDHGGSIRVNGVAWSLIAIAIIGALAMVTGAILQFVAWVGALINTARLEDKAWFVVLLVVGLLGLSFIAMIVYLVAGPDGVPPEPRYAAPAWPAGYGDPRAPGYPAYPSYAQESGYPTSGAPMYPPPPPGAPGTDGQTGWTPPGSPPPAG